MFRIVYAYSELGKNYMDDVLVIASVPELALELFARVIDRNVLDNLFFIEVQRPDFVRKEWKLCLNMEEALERLTHPSPLH